MIVIPHLNLLNNEHFKSMKHILKHSLFFKGQCNLIHNVKKIWKNEINPQNTFSMFLKNSIIKVHPNDDIF